MQTKQMVSHLAVVVRVPHILTYHQYHFKADPADAEVGNSDRFVHWCKPSSCFAWPRRKPSKHCLRRWRWCHVTCQMTKRFAEICTWNSDIGDKHRLTVIKMKPGVVLQVTTWRHSNSWTFFSTSTLPSQKDDQLMGASVSKKIDGQVASPNRQVRVKVNLKGINSMHILHMSCFSLQRFWFRSSEKDGRIW